MNRRKRWLSWALGTGAVLTLGAGLGLMRGPVQAQVMDQPAREKRIFTNKNSFRMPVKMDEAARANLKEVRLYVKNGANDWVCQETAPPSVQFFNYQVPTDGEYWFSVATVDRNGVMTPADIGKQTPGLQVVVDTNPPDLEFKTLTAPDGETRLQCVFKDTHPDYQSLRVIHRGPNGEQVLEPHSFKAGLFHVPEPEMWGSTVRVSACDRCGNKILRELKMPTLADSGSVVTSKEPALAKNDTTVVQKSSFETSSTKTDSIPVGPRKQDHVISQTVTSTAPAPAPFKIAPETTVTEPDLRAPKLSTNLTQPNSPASRQLLNTTHASLEYRIEQVGPSGVGKVEIYMTGDHGNTWQRLRDDADRRSPADVDLPGEGLFGVTLVVTNGNGFGGKAPGRGDAPTAWIEIDTTPPFVQLRDMNPTTDGGTLEIRWTASDKNLADEPVNLYFRTRQEGAWKIIARNIKNDGVYKWAFPHDLGSQFFFRVEVADQAGNVTRADSTNPIVLDMTEPRASVVGVTGVSARQH